MITAEYEQGNVTILQIQNVLDVSSSFFYSDRQSLVILRRVSINIKNRSDVTIAASSGCKKSTRISSITGLKNLESGSIKQEFAVDPLRTCDVESLKISRIKRQSPKIIGEGFSIC